MEDAGNLGVALEWSGLLSKWRSFTPIIARFHNITNLQFIFLTLPRTFPVALTSLPMLSDLTLEQCTFRGPATFYGLQLKILRLRIKDICWDNEPDEISLLRSCPLLRVLYLGWHYRIADTLNIENTRDVSQHLYDLTVNSVPRGWSSDQTKRLQEQRTFFTFIEAWRGLKSLTLVGSWPFFEAGAFPAVQQAFPDYLDTYNGPIHFFRSAIPPHIGLKKAVFLERHLSLPELQVFLPSLPVVTRVALTGICLKKDTNMGEDALRLVFKQCKLLEEFMIVPAHVPLHGAAWILDMVRRSLHHLQNIRLIYIPRIDAYDLDVEQAFDGLHDICPSLREVQFHDRKWVFGNGIASLRSQLYPLQCLDQQRRTNNINESNLRKASLYTVLYKSHQEIVVT
ncbi:hypothetical protein LENED_001494 [Lentinula edodes]|uniref:F-box domain-containing protein n=1 Tax=Lentinula edodes TaxID=5353 RepID=A0A1Q3DYD2_LENED|nr:hypothetical protein LENED_001494 [Lentinula edodes]